MLCCRCLQNNLHIACISIGLIELTLCMLRFGILSTRIECICQPARYQFLCTPIMRFSREFIFLFEVASSVVIIVGTDKRNPRYMLFFIGVCLTIRLVYLPTLIRLFLLQDFVVFFILVVALVPAFFFCLIVASHRRYLVETALDEASNI